MDVNLQAYRCPDATSLMRRSIDLFLKDESQSLTIQSIEPSLVRNIKGYIESLSLALSIKSETYTDITDEDKLSWEDSFDEEDYEDVTQITSITIIKSST